jgi:hypothetical protein
MVSLLPKSTEKKDNLGDWQQGSVMVIAANYGSSLFKFWLATTLNSRKSFVVASLKPMIFWPFRANVYGRWACMKGLSVRTIFWFIKASGMSHNFLNQWLGACRNESCPYH